MGAWYGVGVMVGDRGGLVLGVAGKTKLKGRLVNIIMRPGAL